MKKFFVMVICIFVCVSLASCAVKSDTYEIETTMTESTQETTTAAETNTAAENSDATTTTEETTTAAKKQFTFTVPSGSEVTVNGEVLDLETASSAEIPELIEYAAQYVDDIPEFVTVTAGFDTDNLTVSGTDINGNDLVFTNDGNSYSGVSSASQEFIDEVSERVSAGLSAWGLHFINCDDARPYVHYDSELYGMIFGSADYDWINNTFYNYETITSTNYSTFEISNYVTFGSECFAVDVKYKLDVEFQDSSRHDDNQQLDATMVWIPEGDTWSIFDVTYKPEYKEYPSYEGVEFISLNEKTYTGTLIEVSDPSKVSVGVIDDLGSTTGLKIKELMEQYNSEGVNVIAATNGGDFVDEGTYIYTGTPLGLVISDGEIVYADAGNDASYRIAGFTYDNKMIMGEYTANEALEMGVRDAIYCEYTTGPFLIENGQVRDDIPASSSYGCGKNARTAIGQKEDGTILLLCVNGRQSNSLGATIEDLADIMLEYGAVNAVTMDGGSSSQMGAKYADGSYEYINNPFTPAFGPRACPTFWIVKE